MGKGLRHATVVGAGIVGLASARALLAAGYRVRLLDRCAEPGQGASARNGAQLSYAYVAPLAAPSLWAELPGLLWRADSPLRLSPAGVMRHLPWCVRFLAACRSGPHRATTAALFDLAQLSRRELDDWRGTAAPGLVRACGKLVLYGTEAGFDKARGQMALLARLGGRQQALAAQDCRAVEPSLDGARPAFAGGIHTPDECVVDPAVLMAELHRQLHADPAFEWQPSCEVVRFDLRGDRVDAVHARTPAGDPVAWPVDELVLTAGVDSAGLARALCRGLAVAPLKGYSLDLDATRLDRFPSTSITDTARRIVFAPLAGGDGPPRLRVAGMAELTGSDTGVDPRRIAQLVDATRAWFGLGPLDDTVALRPWAGLRPATPSGLPYIGRFRHLRNASANTGHGPLGLTLAFGSAAVLVAAMERRAAAIDARPYAVAPLAWA